MPLRTTPPRPLTVRPRALHPALPRPLRIAPARAALAALTRAAQPAPPSILQTVDIRRLVPVVLDLAADNYTQWRRHFDTALGMFGLHDHVDADALHRPDDPEWVMADHAVVHWLSSTISPDLLDAVMQPKDTVVAVWAAVDAIFRANQLSRAVYIDAEYHALVQGDLTVMQYCTKLKVFTNQLRDLGQPVSEPRHVFHLLHGLNRQYHAAIPHITSRDPLPSFMETRSFLLLEELRADQAARHQNVHALVAARPAARAPPALIADPAPPPLAVGVVMGANVAVGTGGASSSARPQPPRPPPGYPAPAPGANSWTGLVQAWPVAWRAPGAGVFGPRPGTPHQQSMMAVPTAPPAHPAYCYGRAPVLRRPTSTHLLRLLPRSRNLRGTWRRFKRPCTALHPGHLRQAVPPTVSVEFDEFGFSVKDLRTRMTQFERPLLALQTDNGREFDNAATRSLLAAHGTVLSRVRAGLFRPNLRYARDYACVVDTAPPAGASPLPTSVRAALRDPNWLAAMRDEFTALVSNRTWELLPRPPRANLITGKWVYRHKTRADGSLERYKARWVVCGFRQRMGVDYGETFSPVVKPATIRTVLTIAASRRWPVHQLNVKNAFLHGDLREEVYCLQPAGFVDAAKPDHVCKLAKSLYGLKQVPRAWFLRFPGFVSTIGFRATRSDSSLFLYKSGTDAAFLLLYVDDIILTASSVALLHRIVSKLTGEFAMKDLGELHYFLGIRVTRSPSGFFLSQQQYADDILERGGMDTCKLVATPVDTKAKLPAADGPPVDDPTAYRSLAGALQYLTITRPELAYVVQQVCLHMHDPRAGHLALLKHTRRSTSGFCVYLGDALVSWSSKRQATLSRSSAEAEYRVVANAVAECVWLRQLLGELLCPLRSATLVFCDSISAVYLSSNPVHHQRTKHVELDIHFVHERVALGEFRILHVPTRQQFADVMIKGLPADIFREFRSSLCVSSSDVTTAGGMLPCFSEENATGSKETASKNVANY
ncbi:uncharacterized protein [Aegilops tauschii subsp. strangulata]|uniref:uncharacterized protein n=1 Tax=Aegilops tauschii subsp. strangulata TaxID=200361 RepID=UPI003CC8DB8F